MPPMEFWREGGGIKRAADRGDRRGSSYTEKKREKSLKGFRSKVHFALERERVSSTGKKLSWAL